VASGAGIRCLAGLGLVLTAAASTTSTAVAARPSPPAGVYVVSSGSDAAAAAAVRSAGGTVLADLPLVGAVDARLGTPTVRMLTANRSVWLTPDVTMTALGQSYGAAAAPAQLARMDVGNLWSPQGGAGVGVALIDTGVADSPGLTAANIVRSPDFSGTGGPLDGYGHGTFMAGLIAGNGTGGAGAVPGVAPGVTLVAVKVAGSDGSTTLSKVIEGIAWAIVNRSTYNIRVMSLSFGADFDGPPAVNPLDLAVQAAWGAGITVVAAAGNEGPGHVTSPGDDPDVITVGAETTTGPLQSTAWSGYSNKKPDLLAPGTSVVSLRDPGSSIDVANPAARVGDLYFLGSGTSMSTALTAGAAALLVAGHPAATPDQVKAATVSASGAALSGPAGPIDLAGANGSPAWSDPHLHQPAPGGVGSQGSSSASPDSMRWDSIRWDSIRWDSIRWDSIRWDSIRWDSIRWDSIRWDTVRWDSVRWDASGWADQAWGA
jgi:serine protease AprX